MARGGKQPGAGRPKGSTNKPQLKDHFTDKEIQAVVKQAKTRYRENDKVLVHVIEQIFGKPQQFIDLSSNGQGLVDDTLKSKGDAALSSYFNGQAKKGRS